MSNKWGQRLGNIIAIITLLTAAGAVYALGFRHEPAQRPTSQADTVHDVIAK